MKDVIFFTLHMYANYFLFKLFFGTNSKQIAFEVLAKFK